MTEKTRNLCAQIPAELHSKVREHQEASGQTLGQYMTWLIKKFYEAEEKPTMKGNQRTVAFQVPEELFEWFKEYLKLSAPVIKCKKTPGKKCRNMAERRKKR